MRFSFRRHGAKESEGADPALTPPGRLQAENEGKRMQPTPDVAVGRGSPRHRTEETVQRIIGAARPERITPMMTAQEVEKEINREFKEAQDKGLPIRKTLSDDRLNFRFEGEMNQEVLKAVKEGHLLEYLVNESDQIVLDRKDRQSTSLSVQAGSIADLLKNYSAGVLKGWRQVSLNKPDDYRQFNYQLERYLGTHAGIAESFVFKLLKNQQGETAAREFLKAYPGGFKELGGVDVQAELIDGQPRFTLTYQLPEQADAETKMVERQVEFGEQELAQLIKEREELRAKVEAV